MYFWKEIKQNKIPGQRYQQNRELIIESMYSCSSHFSHVFYHIFVLNVEFFDQLSEQISLFFNLIVPFDLLLFIPF